MANKKSAIKRIRQNEKRRLRNRNVRGQTRSLIKSARNAIASEDVGAAEPATLQAVKALDKAAQKGVIHKKNASRRKSRLMKRLAALKKLAE